MRGVGFGIEFCNNMDLYEINYGMQMQSGGKTEVNGDPTVSQYGFVTCRYCGKATPCSHGMKKNSITGSVTMLISPLVRI